MKNGYVGANTGELISKYEQSGDKIIITFLDGSYYEVPLTDKNEEEIINIMLGQAEDRKNSDALQQAVARRKKAVKWIFTEAILGVITTTAMLSTDNKTHNIVAGILSGLCGLGVVVNGIRYEINNQEIAELQKYGMYLSMKGRLDNCTNENLFNGVKSKADRLDINTLDQFSFADIRRIRSNLRRIELMTPHFQKRGK